MTTSQHFFSLLTDFYTSIEFGLNASTCTWMIEKQTSLYKNGSFVYTRLLGVAAYDRAPAGSLSVGGGFNIRPSLRASAGVNSDS